MTNRIILALWLLAITASAQIQPVSFGSGLNTRTGDTLLSGGNKINSNFSNLQDQINFSTNFANYPTTNSAASTDVVPVSSPATGTKAMQLQNLASSLSQDAIGGVDALATKAYVASVSTVAALQTVLRPGTNSLQDDLSAWHWRIHDQTLYRHDVINTNGYSLVNPLAKLPSSGFAWSQWAVTAPVGATNISFTISARGRTTNDSKIRIAIFDVTALVELASSNVVITNAHWTNATVTTSATGSSNYNLLIYSHYSGVINTQSFFVATPDVQFNGASTNTFQLSERYLSRGHRDLRERPYAPSHYKFVSSSRTLEFDVWSNAARDQMRFITVLTNGVFAGNVIVTNTAGRYSIDFGSSATRVVQAFNGGIVNELGQIRGTWIRGVSSSDSALIMLVPDETVDLLGLGDSMMAGFVVTNMAASWPYLVEKNTGLRVETHAVGSQALSQYTNSIFQALRERTRLVQPRAIWVEYGFNDWFYTNCTAATFQTWYSNLVYCLSWEAPGARLFLQPPIEFTGAANALGETLANFRTSVTNVAASFPAAKLVDWSSLVKSGEIGTDGVHPNDLGNLRWATEAARLLTESRTDTNGMPRFTDLASGRFTIVGTTNQVKFGSTNRPPANASAVVKWISVDVAGETNAYRLPLYE